MNKNKYSEMTTYFDREVKDRRDILESAVEFYTKVRVSHSIYPKMKIRKLISLKDMWRLFEELREAPLQENGTGMSHLTTFEKNRENVQGAMQLTIATGSDLIAKLRAINKEKSDKAAEQHILDLGFALKCQLHM